MRYLFNILLLASILFSITSCKKKIADPPDLGNAYAPIVLGKYVIYEVDSTIYDDFFKDTIYYKYRIKEKQEESFTDNEGRQVIKLVRYIKKNIDTVSYDNIPWSVKDVWNYTKTATTLEVVEEDIRFTKLIFPVKEDASWNGNAYNTIGEWEYLYKYVNQYENINGTNFDNVLFVEQKDDKLNNQIHRQYYVEKYAKDIGLVYKEIKDLQSFTVTVVNGKPTPVETRISKGVIYTQKYITHGFE